MSRVESVSKGGGGTGDRGGEPRGREMGGGTRAGLRRRGLVDIAFGHLQVQDVS